MDEKTVTMMEGVAREWRVRVKDSAGNVLNPEGFSFYGAAADGVQVPRRMQVRVAGDVVVLVLPGLWMSGRCWRYQVMCQDVLSGVEWVLCQGDVVLERRVACNGPALHEDAVLVDAVLDSELEQVEVFLGDSTAATAEAARLAVAARDGAEAAAERVAADVVQVEDLKRVTLDVAAGVVLAAERAEDSKRGAEAAAGDAAADAQVAAGKAAEAEVSRVAAAADAKLAGARAAEADASAKVAAEAVSDALGARDEAAAARGGAEAAMRAAGDRAGEAEVSADAAGAARAGAEAALGRAEAAMAEAEAAQRKAEAEASKAAGSSALLGDAALKSGDNTFTGGNTFTGEVFGVLPADFWAYTWCTTKEELYAACPDLLKKEMCCIALGELQTKSSEYLLLDNIKKAVLYFVGEIPEVSLGNGLTDLTVIAPNAIKNTWCVSGHVARKMSWKVIMPKREISPRFGNWTSTRSAFLIAKNKIFENRLFSGAYGNSASTMEELIAPLNVVETVNLSSYKVLKNVPVGFPHATSINMNSAVLNKESVRAILKALQPYDANTMSAVPELTLGIDPALNGDEEINAALLNAQEAVENGGKGWNVAAAGFTITAGTGAATMGLRRLVYVKREAVADGGYIDADGQKWNVRWGNTVLENWQANEELGYEAFPSVEAALDEWGLRELTVEDAVEGNEILTER